jgi:hypothetical protein
MNNRLCCNQAQLPPASSRWSRAILLGVLVCLWYVPPMAGGDAPEWMRVLVNTPLPVHDDKTDAILLYSETNVNVISGDKVKEQVRVAYKILRPGGREYGYAAVSFNPRKKVTKLHGWCIPAQGNVYEVKDKDAMEIALPKIEGSELISDVKVKVLEIPASDPGNIVGYEYETEEQLLVLQESWNFQHQIPARESRYSLQLPPGWEYRALWLNYPEVKPTQSGTQWQWTVSDVKAIRKEEEMPPLAGVEGQMVVSFFPSGGAATNGFSNWQQMGSWYLNLTNGRRDGSPEMKQIVTTLTASKPKTLDKMKALAEFAQNDVRYVAIELGVGGWQPHAASEVLVHRYGDCKDKATLLAAMLHEIGVDSYYVIINAERGAVTPDTPAHVSSFNHAILAIKLPDGINDPALVATMQDAKLGKLLFFDPTNELTPFGQIGGYLQGNYGLLVAPGGGELVQLPAQLPAMNGIQRTAKLSLDANGALKGDVKEVRIGDRARSQRRALRNTTKDTDMVKPIERLLADSLPTFQLINANVSNLHHNDQPFVLNFSFQAQHYAKNAGDLLLVRARVMGTKTTGFLETNEPRKFAIEFPAPALDTDTFEIALPAGYEVDELPEPVNAEYSFADYHSKTEFAGGVIRYTRTYEIKELSVPASKADEVKKFYRTIAGDERNMVVLKPSK